MPAPSQPASPMMRTELVMSLAEKTLPVAHKTLSMADFPPPHFPTRESGLFAPASPGDYLTPAAASRHMQSASDPHIVYHPHHSGFVAHPHAPVLGLSRLPVRITPASHTPPPTQPLPDNMSGPPQRTTPLPSPPPIQARASRGRGAHPKFQCSLCSSTFSRKDNMKTHQRIHSGEMPFQCGFCGRRFRWQSSARTHEQVHERNGHTRLPPGYLPAQPARAGAAARRMPTLPPQSAIVKPHAGPARIAAPTELDLDRLLSSGAIGGGLVAEVEAAASSPMPAMAGTTGMSANMPSPTVAAPAGGSPMFSLPSLSQQDLERCLE